LRVVADLGFELQLALIFVPERERNKRKERNSGISYPIGNEKRAVWRGEADGTVPPEAFDAYTQKVAKLWVKGFFAKSDFAKDWDAKPSMDNTAGASVSSQLDDLMAKVQKDREERKTGYEPLPPKPRGLGNQPA